MTMTIRIENTDQARTAEVSVHDVNIDGRMAAPAEVFTLGPGESRAVHIHAARRVLVTEDPMAHRLADHGEPASVTDES